MLKITFTEKYQMFYLKKAINEILQNKDESIIESIEEDHDNGCNYINNIKVPVTFPIYIKDYISQLNKKKNLRYFYRGTIVSTKKWVLKYDKPSINSIIEKSKRGRTKDKYSIDKNYYKTMSRSCFTLCPTEWGDRDKSWTYRFFEAIMCLSIPILENNSNDIYKNDYFYYSDEDEHIYNKDKVIENYQKFINSDHFLHNVKELNFA